MAITYHPKSPFEIRRSIYLNNRDNKSNKSSKVNGLSALDKSISVISAVTKLSSCHRMDTVAHFIQHYPTLLPSDRIIDAITLFHEMGKLNSIPVLKKGKPVGIVLRNDLLNLYSRKFKSSIYREKSISCLMWNHPLIVEENTPLEVISEKITKDADRAAVDDFLVVDGQGRYLGVGKVIDLLKEITALHFHNSH